jgi:hypothetical protein
MVYTQQTVEQQPLPVLDEHLHLLHLGGPLAPLHLAGPAHKLVYLEGWMVLQELLPDLDEYHHLHQLSHLAPHLGGPAPSWSSSWKTGGWCCTSTLALVLASRTTLISVFKMIHKRTAWKNSIGRKLFWVCRIFSYK